MNNCTGATYSVWIPCRSASGDTLTHRVGEQVYRNQGSRCMGASAEQCQILRRAGSCRVGTQEFTDVRENDSSVSIRGRDARESWSKLTHTPFPTLSLVPVHSITKQSLKYVNCIGTWYIHRRYLETAREFYLLRGDLDPLELLRREREEWGSGDRLLLGLWWSLRDGEGLLLPLLPGNPLWSSPPGTFKDLSSSSTPRMASDFPCNSFFFAFFSLLRSFRARLSSAVSPLCFLDFFFLPILSSRRWAMMKSRIGSSGSISAPISDSSDPGGASSVDQVQ